jgi:hypothetical protein
VRRIPKRRQPARKPISVKKATEGADITGLGRDRRRRRRRRRRGTGVGRVADPTTGFDAVPKTYRF